MVFQCTSGIGDGVLKIIEVGLEVRTFIQRNLVCSWTGATLCLELKNDSSCQLSGLDMTKSLPESPQKFLSHNKSNSSPLWTSRSRTVTMSEPLEMCTTHLPDKNRMFAQLFQPCYGVATQKTGYPEMSYSAETEIDGSYHLVLHQAQILTHTHSMIHLPNGTGLKLLTHGCYMSQPSGMTLLRLLVRLSLHTDSSIIMYQHTHACC